MGGNSRCGTSRLISTELLTPFRRQTTRLPRNSPRVRGEGRGKACQSLQADERSPNKSWQHIHRQSRLNCCINPEARVPTQQFNKRRCAPPRRSGEETDLTARGACRCQAGEAVSVMGQRVNCFQCHSAYLLAFFRHCQ